MLHEIAFALSGFLAGSFFGLMLGAVLAAGKHADDCSDCLARKRSEDGQQDAKDNE
jgi:hypothetical protein